MLSSFVPVLIVTAVLGAFFGAASYRYWLARNARQNKRIPAKWQLDARPLFNDVERTVWRWLRQVFFDHQLLLKVPVIRFLSPQSASQGQHSHELLKGIYCSFTVCAANGKVIGCIDVPGVSGLKASHRDMKQKLFHDCGIAYAVLSANNLPTLEALRTTFLGALASVNHAHNQSEFMASVQPHTAELVAFEEAAAHHKQHAPAAAHKTGAPTDATDPTDIYGHTHIDMLAVAAARSSLQSKLERNRKTRIATIESLSASMGIVDDSADQGFVVQWDDSFIMGEESGQTATNQ
ncbi:MAG: DUF2726 domain-containing protein [Polaromonas sp.]|nr:DUF2726 domain-containing protein [Polaromonas sp.]